MRRATWVLVAGVVSSVAACSLTTSFDGLSTGGTEGAPDKGDASGTLDASTDGPNGTDGGTDGNAASDGGTGYRGVVLSDSPLAYYRLDDQGTTAKDEVGAHDGTYEGAVTHGAAGAIAGDANLATAFDGTSGYVDVGDVLPFLMTSPFTIEAWTSPVSGASDPMCIASKSFASGGLNGSITEGWTFYLDSGTNAINVARYTSGAADAAQGGAAPLAEFAHVVTTYDGATLTVWLNGVSTGSTDSTRQLVDHTKPLTIGASRGGIYCFFRGALDEVALYGTALSAERIRAHFHAGIGK
jgi:hypothetical protein